MPYTPWFPEPGSYIKYFDPVVRAVRYRQLLWRRGPMMYPRRMAALAANTKASQPINYDELNPADTNEHIYLAYIGFKPGCRFYIYHPADLKLLRWDARIDDIDEDLTAALTWEESPYEFPSFAIGIERDRYPGIQPFNLEDRTINPEFIIVASVYKVVEHEAIPEDILQRLESGSVRAHPWDFGGEL